MTGSAAASAESIANRGDGGTADDKESRFVELADGIHGFSVGSEANSGVIIGDDNVLVFDAQATPARARRVLAHIAGVTTKPVDYVVLSHHHAARTLGASAYPAREIISSRVTYDRIIERGQQDFETAVARAPETFAGRDEIPGLTWPTMTFESTLTLWLGNRRVDLIHYGRGHTGGDIILWLTTEQVLFAGDLVQHAVTPHAGDAHLGDWLTTLDHVAALEPKDLVSGRGQPVGSAEGAMEAIRGTQRFIRELMGHAVRGVDEGLDLKGVYDATMAAMRPTYGSWPLFKQRMPYNVARAYEEAQGVAWPTIWTVERDRALHETLGTNAATTRR